MNRTLPPCSRCDPSANCWSGATECEAFPPRKAEERINEVPTRLQTIIRRQLTTFASTDKTLWDCEAAILAEVANSHAAHVADKANLLGELDRMTAEVVEAKELYAKAVLSARATKQAIEETGAEIALANAIADGQDSKERWLELTEALRCLRQLTNDLSP